MWCGQTIVHELSQPSLLPFLSKITKLIVIVTLSISSAASKGLVLLSTLSHRTSASRPPCKFFRQHFRDDHHIASSPGIGDLGLTLHNCR